MRVFVAVVPPLEVVEHLESFVQPRRDAVAGRGEWRWTRSEHLHLTLAFVPDLEEWREEAFIEAGQEWAQRQAPVTLRLAGAGAFPDPGGARVLWAGVGAGLDEGPPGQDGTDTLAAWAKGLRAVASRAGARVDGTRFHPHLTLARSIGGPRPAGHLLQSLDTLRSPAWQVSEVALVASHLGQGPRGTPRYDVRHTWALS